MSHEAARQFFATASWWWAQALLVLATYIV